jgi:F-type H+-transporting ATPase subunit O
VKLPAQVYGVPGRYANALYVSAVKANQLEKVAEELKTFMQAYDTDANLKRYVRDPSVPRNVKAETMISVLKQNTDVTKHFFGKAAPSKLASV